MNRVIIIGNLTKDTETRTTQSGKTVTSFTVAVNRKSSDKKEADYIPVVTWEKLAETCAQWLTKGKKVGVSGRIQTRSYEAADGSKRYVTEIVADEVEFLTPKAETPKETSGTPNLFHKNKEFEPTDEQLPF